MFGAALGGVVAMYFLDPDGGERRRRTWRDVLARLVMDLTALLRIAERDATSRARNVAVTHAATFIWTDHEGEIVAECVRDEVYRVVSHPDAIDVAASGGLVTLSGMVLLSEQDGLIDAVVRVPGVTAIENLLDVHDDGVERGANVR